MKLRIICVGKLKEAASRDWLAEYQKRLGKYASVEWVEFKEYTPVEEAKEILKRIKDEYVILLDRVGVTVSSEEFASHLKKHTMQKDIVFVIGGPSGVTQDVKKRANLMLSFGPMTFPHQLARVMLAEQLYRAFTIIKGEPYHK